MKRYIIIILILGISDLWAMDAHQRIRALVTDKFETAHVCNESCNTVLECYKKKSLLNANPAYILAIKCRFDIEVFSSESSQSISDENKVKNIRNRLFSLSLGLDAGQSELYYAVFAHDRERVVSLLKSPTSGKKIAHDNGTDIFGARFENILFYMARVLNTYEEYANRFDKREFQSIFELIASDNPELLTQTNDKGLTPLDILEQTHNNFKSICYPGELSAYEVATQYKTKPLNRAQKRASRKLTVTPVSENSSEESN